MAAQGGQVNWWSERGEAVEPGLAQVRCDCLLKL